MGNAPTPVPHTMMNLVKAGGFDTSDEACKKALAKCGLDPDQFGTYNQVNSSQRDTRQDLQRRARAERAAREGGSPNQHCTPCSGGTPCRCHESDYARATSTPGEFWHANSQAGHLSQDAISREPGARGDPCMNYPPGPGHGGTYGYDVNRAPCMDHAGRSSQPGSPHYAVCRTEDSFGAAVAGQPVSQDTMREGVARSAATAVTGQTWETDPSTGALRRVNPTDPAAQQVQSDFRQRQIAQASADSGAAAGAGAGAGTPSTAAGLSKDEQHAIACIVAQWEKGVAAMQQDSINRYGPGSPSANARAEAAYRAETGDNTPWSQMSASQRSAAVAARQRQLEAAGANANPFASGSAADRARCREYQANWLWQQSAGANPPRTGFPPMQGFGGSMSGGTGGTTTTTGGESF